MIYFTHTYTKWKQSEKKGRKEGREEGREGEREGNFWKLDILLRKLICNKYVKGNEKQTFYLSGAKLQLQMYNC